MADRWQPILSRSEYDEETGTTTYSVLKPLPAYTLVADRVRGHCGGLLTENGYRLRRRHIDLRADEYVRPLWRWAIVRAWDRSEDARWYPLIWLLRHNLIHEKQEGWDFHWRNLRFGRHPIPLCRWP